MKKKILPLLAMLTTFSVYASVNINEMMVRNVSSKINENYNFEGWVELYNSGAQAVDLSNCFFSDNQEDIYLWQNKAQTILQPGEFAIFYFDELDQNNHASFKLDSDGGILILSDQSGTILDMVKYPKPIRNASYGRTNDGEDNFAFFITPTQGTTNNNSATATQQTAAPSFGTQGGFFSSSQSITINAENPSAKIFYTTDGSEPKANSSMQYSSPFTVSTTTPIRAIAVVDGEISSDVTTATYFINNGNNIPTSTKVISLVTDRDYVYGDELGAFVIGRNGSTVPSKCGSMDRTANYMNDWDRPCNIELFDENKTSQINQEVKIGVFGACSRTKSIKSIKVKANKIYGNNKLDYAIFKEKPNLKWKSFVLRNSGNDFGRMLFRDGYLQSLVATAMDIDHQAYEPAVIFMNGEYYGMLGIRERTNKDFVYSNYGLDEEEICIEETSARATECDDYQAVLNLTKNSNMNAAGVFDQIDKTIDVNECLNYFMTEIYICNEDWSEGNIKAWHRTSDGKWRWILYDTDYSTSLYQDYLSTNGFVYSAKCKFFPQFIKNDEIKKRLMTKFVAHAGTTFESEHVSFVLDSMKNILSDEADYFFNFLTSKRLNEKSSWQEEAEKVRNFLTAREAFVFKHVADSLKLGSPVDLHIYSNLNGGMYTLNGLETIKKSNFRSKYFTGSAITVKAEAPAGYKFSKWEVCSENYLIQKNDTWKYLYQTDAADYSWKEVSFNDNDWLSGTAPLGIGLGNNLLKTTFTSTNNNQQENPDTNPGTPGGNQTPGQGNTGINPGGWTGGGMGDWTGGGMGDWTGGGMFFGSSANTTTYLRKTFTISQVNSLATNLQCTVHLNDGAIIYVNGKEVYRYNMPNMVNDTMKAIYEMDSYATLNFEIPRSNFTSGTNVIAVELHNAKNSGSLLFDLSLLDENTGVSVINSSNNAEYTTTVNNNLTIRAVYEKDNYWNPSDVKLYINEVCAANKQYVDEYREENDWIEIYNDGTEAVDLAGMYISDQRDNLTRYKIPTGNSKVTTVPAKGYLVIWADADSTTQGPLHTNFKLNKNKSQTVCLSQMVNNTIQVIDSIAYIPHKNGQSYSRFSYSGNGSWTVTSIPTFAKVNAYAPVSSSTNDLEIIANDVQVTHVYPNPAEDYLWFSFDADKALVTIADLSGRILINEYVTNGSSIFVGNLPTDLYALNLTINNSKYSTKIIKK